MLLKKTEQILLFLAIFLLPTQLGKHFWPSFSYIYSLPIDYLSPTLYFWDILAVVLFFAWLSTKPKVNTRALNLLLFFILVQTLSLFRALSIGASLVALGQFFAAGLFGLYIASKSLREIKQPLLWGLLGAVVVEGLLALYQFFSTHTLGLWILGERSFSISTPSIATFNFLGQVFLRPYGTFPHPNVLAAFMVLVLPLIMVIQEEKMGRVRAGLLFPTLFIGALASILSFSRTGIFVMGLEVIYLFRKRWKWLLIPLAVLAPLIWIRYSSAFNFDYLSILRREQLDVIAGTDFLSSPIFGIGLNNFILVNANSPLIAGPTRFLQPAHNIVLLAMAETGIVGFLGWTVLIGVAIKKLWKDRVNDLSNILLYSWGTILFLGMFDHYFLTLPQGQRMLFLFWGLSLL